MNRPFRTFAALALMLMGFACEAPSDPAGAAGTKAEPQDKTEQETEEKAEEKAEDQSEEKRAYQRPPSLVPEQGVAVAHALGEIDGHRYTNSLEAFRAGYEAGFRWFEVDLALTSDDVLVCFHTELESVIGLKRPVSEVPAAEVIGKKYAGRYPVVTFVDLLKEASTRDGVVLVTDTKKWSPKIAKAVKEAVSSLDDDALPTQLAFQAYGKADLPLVADLANEIGATVFLTLYMTVQSDEAVLRLTEQYGLGAIVASRDRFNPWLAHDLRAIGVPTFVHTVYDPKEAARWVSLGAAGVYSERYISAEQLDAQQRPNLPTLEQTGALDPWLRPSIHDQPTRFHFKPWTKKRGSEYVLKNCKEGSAVFGPYVPVREPSSVHVTAEVRSVKGVGAFWIDAVAKFGTDPIHGRQSFRVQPGASRLVEFAFEVDHRVSDLEVRLGCTEPSDGELRLGRFEMSVGSPSETGTAG
jgi:glycerophosphoryl diester phosphodiesterase